MKLEFISLDDNDTSNVLVGQSFELTLLLNASDTITSNGTDSNMASYPVNLGLYFQDTNSSSYVGCSPNILIREDSSKIMECKKCKLKLKLMETSLSAGNNRAFIIRACIEGVAETISKPIMCFKYRLKVTNIDVIPEVWYKDDIGRDKGIEVNVSLVNFSGSVIINKRIPLKPTLMYSDNTKVAKQEIMFIAPDSRLTLDGIVLIL